ncbi:nuclear transport factor 2 family protein [Streptomyces sp. NPDC012888]|uniref:nuclear transport factor 2 family protein n=1 Tax=Streptomyces sp. NPDC012888 TaxID=3364855 RepID=UPI003695FF81
MNVRRRDRTGLLAAATVVTTLVAGLVAGSPGAGTATATAEGGECPQVRPKVELLEGRITPNACAFMRRQIAFGEAPALDTYLDIFDADASLWEAGSPAQRGHAAIGASITRSLALVPDLRYRGTEVVTDGTAMFFGQHNEVTIKGRKVAYPQIARNVLGDDGKTIQARRYYDRYELFEPLAPELRPRPLFDGVADSGRPYAGPAAGRFRARDVPSRLAAWNDGDVAALLGRAAGRARLTGPGLDAPLTTRAGQSAYLERFFAKADVRFAPGQAVFGRTTAYVEWHGTATVLRTAEDPDGTDVPFGIVERFGPDGEWELSFDTLPLIATPAEITALFKAIG